MKRTKFISYILLASGVLLSPSALAAPSAGIRTLLSTPASAFDVFLHQLYVAANGPAFFGGPNMNEQLRISVITYDYDSNVINMSFHIGPEHKLMKGFNSRDIEGRKDILLRAAKDVATSLGLEARDGILRIGLIQFMKIRNGWATKDFPEAKIKNEIADRTVFELIYASEEKAIYKVRRDQSGRYEFSVDTKSIQ